MLAEAQASAWTISKYSHRNEGIQPQRNDSRIKVPGKSVRGEVGLGDAVVPRKLVFVEEGPGVTQTE